VKTITALLAFAYAAASAGPAAAQAIQPAAANAAAPAAAVGTTLASAAEGTGGAGQFHPRPVPNETPRFGIGVKAGTLGIGFNVGTALSSRINIRGGANFFEYQDSLTEDGINYKGTLQLRSVEAKLDLFLVGGFRVTPGFLLYNDNKISATVAVPGGQSFTLGGTRYFSSVANPITGTAALTLNRTAPTLGIGFGNLLPRSGRHFSVSTDIGIVFQGSPQFALGLAGSSCSSTFTICAPINTIPGTAANIQSEQQKISDDLKPFKYYPELSVTFGWSF
jgi:hypothetical protein